LLENAVRYGGAAKVSWATHGSNLVLKVDDNGPGIPTDQLEKVFDPFYRLEQSRSLETGGYGLGLSIARTIIQSHGGDIQLVNRNGAGLRAIVTIPLDENELIKGETDDTQNAHSNVSGQRARQHGAS
jgi:signal transduction histidine kinase